MILCLRLCLRASRSLFSISTATNNNNYYNVSRFLFQFSTLPHCAASSSSSSSSSSNLESYYANLILSSQGDKSNRNWSSNQFRLLFTDPDLLIRVLNMIRVKPQIAFRFFKWLQRQSDVKQSRQVFAAMLEILAENDLMREAYLVAERSIDLGLHEIDDLLIDGNFDKLITLKLLDLLLWVYSKKSMAEQCLLSFEKMIRKGFLPSVRNCNIVLRVLRDSRMMNKGGEVYGTMVEHGIMPTVITFNTMLDSCFKAGDLQQVAKIWSEMERRNIEFSEVTYNILINGFSKNGKMEEARRFHGDMRRSGFPVTAYSFNPLIEGYCKQGLFDEALGVRDEMIKAGISPTTSTYNIFIRALCEFGRIDEARQLLSGMNGPDVVSYNTLMHGYIKMGKIVEASLLFDDLRAGNISPSIVTYNTLIDGLCESGNLEGAQRLKEEMTSQLIFPDVKTYTTLVKGFVKIGNLSMATEIYDEMLRNGIKPDRYAYTTRNVGELRLGDSEKAFCLHEEMVVKDHHAPELTIYNVHIDGLCKVGNLEKAIEFQRKIFRVGLVPDHVTYTTVIQAYLEKGRFKMARDLYDEMLRKRLSPSVITYFVLIHGHEMSSKFEMSDLGRLTYYLGIEVTQFEGGIMLSQRRYAQNIIEEAGMEKCNPVHIPMESGLKLSKSEDEKEIDATTYRKHVGCLRYLLHTRPDLSYCVGILSRYMQSPRESHGNAMKQCLRYLRGTTSLGLVFKRSLSRVPKLIGYSDSSHNVDPDDGKSTTGHVFYLNSSPITWCSQKQETVALSSCEAEFMAGTEAARQAIWLQDLLGEVLGVSSEKVIIRIDNQSAIALTKNPVFHGRSKHIHTRYHFIRECVEMRLIEVEHVSGDKQKADILTKALGRIKFKEMRDFIGVEDLEKMDFKLKRENVG